MKYVILTIVVGSIHYWLGYFMGRYCERKSFKRKWVYIMTSDRAGKLIKEMALKADTDA